MKRRTNPATDVVERARAAYPKAVNAARAYFGPVPYGQQTMTRERADLALAQMDPHDIASLAVQNPIAAEQAPSRLNVIDARAAASTPYSDIGPED